MRAYIGPSRNDWVNYLDTLALSYNSTPHMATGFAPVHLLRGYIPTTGSTLVHHPDGIARPATESGSHNLGNVSNSDETSKAEHECGSLQVYLWENPRVWKLTDPSHLSSQVNTDLGSCLGAASTCHKYS